MQVNFNLFKSVLLATILLMGCALRAQTITLTPDVTLDPSVGPCTEISAGTTLTFNRSSSCDQDILITTNIVPPVELFQSDETTVTYLFAEEGSYVVFCGAPAPNDVAIQAICVNVGPAANPIPTIGEWGIIMAMLLLLIVGMVFLRQSSRQEVHA